MKTYIKKVCGAWHAFGMTSGYQVRSIGADCPRDGGVWFAQGCTDGAVQYVSSPSSTRRAAYQKARRWGEYSGEI